MKSSSYNRLRQMRLIIFQWGFNSGACLRIPELGFYGGVLLFEYVQLFWTRDIVVLVNTTYHVGCCNLMLIQPWIEVMYFSLLWLILNIRMGISISHLSIAGIVAHGRCFLSLFSLAFVLSCFPCSACILQICINLTSFLFSSKFFFSLSLSFCPSHYCSVCCYYCDYYYFQLIFQYL